MSSKRTFPKTRIAPSVAYDASEEDLTDTDVSISSMPVPQPQPGHIHPPRPSGTRKSGVLRAKHHLAHAITSEDDGVDSPTYDGDVESSATVTHSRPFTPDTVLDSSASASTLTSPLSAVLSLPGPLPHEHIESVPSPAIGAITASSPVSPRAEISEPTPAESSRQSFDPANLTPQDIRQFVSDAINGAPTEKGAPRTYKINPPPTDRPIRVYADGVYDLFHFGHALQLRQAKLSFPSVYLMVGCNSDDQVREHKNKCVMNHAERCEAIRHCRWVDKIIAEAPWVITPEFIEKYQIDYVAHDEDPYAGAGVADVYQTVKDMGKFIPTRRTPGISTSELLERIVQKYRRRDFDAKLEKMGHAELKAAGSDYDDGSDDGTGKPRGSRARSRRRIRDTVKETVKDIVGGPTS